MFLMLCTLPLVTRNASPCRSTTLEDECTTRTNPAPKRIGRYYTEQEKPADWVLDRLAWRIADKTGLHGRHTIRRSFHRQGFPLA